MAQINPGEAVPVFDPTAIHHGPSHDCFECRVREEGSRHDCCCDHVVDSLEAASMPAAELRAVVRDRYYACPHKEITPLEMLLSSLPKEVS